MTAVSHRKYWLWLLAAVGTAVLIYTAVMYRRIDRQAEQDETQPADVIVVFGAAEYAGHPSPVYKARLDHGLALYERHIAPLVITTGGAGGDPRYTEGAVGHDYLMARGIPDQNLIAETQADNTVESAERVAGIMQANHLRTCVAVSDGYHMFRIKKALERNGVQAYAAPRPETRSESRWHHASEILREVVSYTLWKAHIT